MTTINEIETFRLQDAVTFHDKLNPKLFAGQKLRPDVKRQLTIIAQDFLEELGISGLDVKDITVSGSNAAYSYTNHSDLDLHILVDMSGMPDNEIYKELFTAKKTIYNDTHNIKVHGIPVELYVQDASEPVVSLGEYSLMNNEWIRIPTKRRAGFDQTASAAKYNKLKELLVRALKSKDLAKVTEVLKTIRRYRQAGLDKGGEFGPENLAYKALRSQGFITKLYALKDELHSKKLSIESMYVSESKLSEGISPIVYHYTRARTARNILSTGEFQLSSTLGSVEEQYAPKGYPYFLSTTRTRRGGYHYFVGSDAVLFVLDGTWYNRHYKGAPVDYWLNRDHLKSNHRPHEAEDRIFSKDPKMSAKGVTAIHLYVSSDAEPQTRAWARQTLILAKRMGIPAYFYTDKEAWKNQDTRKMGDVSVLKGQDTTRGYVSSHNGYLIPWIELVNAKDKSQLSKKADALRYSLQYSYDKESAAQGLANDLSNARKPESGADREHAVNIIRYMQANKLNTVKDLVNNLTDKWKSVEKVTEANTRYAPYFDKENLTEQEKYLNSINGTVPMSSWMIFVEEFLGNKNLLESADQDILSQVKALEKLSVKNPIVGKKYIPIPIIVIGNNIHIMDISGQDSLKTPAQLLPLESKSDFTYTFTFQDRTMEYPYGKSHKSLYSTVIIAGDEDTYDKIKMLIELYFDKRLPPIQDNNIKESGSGYIPSEKQKRDPRYSTALTVDVHPDSIQKNAKAFKSKVSRAGIPPIANPNGKF
jgi:hypothetical protein